MKTFRDFIFEKLGRMRIVMLGGPGSGKSTYSKFLTKEFMIPHVYTGDMMRSLAQQDTEIGRNPVVFVAALYGAIIIISELSWSNFF